MAYYSIMKAKEWQMQPQMKFQKRHIESKKPNSTSCIIPFIWHLRRINLINSAKNQICDCLRPEWGRHFTGKCTSNLLGVMVVFRWWMWWLRCAHLSASTNYMLTIHTFLLHVNYTSKGYCFYNQRICNQ